jgi:hypothetical protein
MGPGSPFRFANMLARRLFHLCPPSRSSLYSSAPNLRFTMASQTQRHYSPVALLPPREFPSTGFEVIDPSQSVEEERLPFYNCHAYYPMRIGAVIKDRYQVVAKLGYGTSSSVWLCHDLMYALRLSDFDCPVC